MSMSDDVPDPSLDAAVSKIMALGSEKFTQDSAKLDRLERTGGELDTHEQDASTDLDEAESAERTAKADDTTGDDEPEATEAEFISIGEGEEAEKIPLAEAVEAVKQFRQMQGDVATAVIRVETEAQQKQDQITDHILTTYRTVNEQAKVALQAMQAYMPQPPDPIMLDRNSGYYDPETYHVAKIRFDEHSQFMSRLAATVRETDQSAKDVSGQYGAELTRRESDRLARFIPEWKDEKAREVKKGEILEFLSGKYGVTKADLDDIVDHKAWRMMHDLMVTAKAERKAPEVRKAVQEKAPKLTKERALPGRTSDGKFISDARKALKESGSEDAFAQYLLRSGATKPRR